MSAVSELIQVTYKDMTNYAPVVGGDVLGCPFEHFWGPVGTLKVFNRQTFFETYPEELPADQSTVKGSRFFAYANIKKAFANGMGSAEVYRVQGNWKYVQLKISATTRFEIARNFTANQVSDPTDCMFAIYSKYPGIPPTALLNGDVSVAVNISAIAEDLTFTIKVQGVHYSKKEEYADFPAYPVSPATPEEGETYYAKNYSLSQNSVLETFTVSLDPNATIDGNSIFIEDVLEKSQFITAKVGTEKPEQLLYGAYGVCAYLPFELETTDALASDGVTATAKPLFDYIDEPTSLMWSNALAKYNDTMLSQATLLINPTGTGEVKTELDDLVKNTAGERQDMNGVIGYDIASPFTYDDIHKVLLEARGSGVQPKFSMFVAGREKYSIFGLPVILNCVGGWCGATVAVAQAERVNQLASAFTYGSYSGFLTESLSFTEVNELMSDGGISVFTSVRGPLIWGTRTLHPRQESYFGKANVMRVLARILRQVFPICINILHTDAAANPLTREIYQGTFTGIVNDEIAAENLLGDSYADCGSTVNTDVTTKGGTIFNLNLVLHFIGLVESIKINVIATDTSVTTSIE